MTSNCSLILDITAEPASKAIIAHQRSLDSLAKIILDNSSYYQEFFDCLLAEQGDVCVQMKGGVTHLKLEMISVVRKACEKLR